MMKHDPDNESTPGHSGFPAGLFAALVCAALLVGAFALLSAPITMPAAERWAALTTVALLALAYTLQGSIGVYDALGRAVQRDWRALAVLLAFFPVLYAAYSAAVEEFSWRGLLVALVFVALPAVALLRSQGRRTLSLLDLVAVFYLWLSLAFNLVPGLTLPQQGGLVGFFQFGAAPLLLLLLAARGWPGLGFSWFLSGADLRVVVVASLAAVLGISALALALGVAQPQTMIPPPLELLGRAVLIYFFTALPDEILFRGVLQNGIARRLTPQRTRRSTNPAPTPAPWRAALASPRNISVAAAALLYGAAYALTRAPDWRIFVLAAIAGLAYGLVYQRTGKVTASAVVHMLVLWCWSMFLQ